MFGVMSSCCHLDNSVFKLVGVFCFGIFETESYYVAQAGLELMVLLPRLAECWNDRSVPPLLVQAVFCK
jgi:hypothetical protein